MGTGGEFHSWLIVKAQALTEVISFHIVFFIQLFIVLYLFIINPLAQRKDVHCCLA